MGEEWPVHEVLALAAIVLGLLAMATPWIAVDAYHDGDHVAHLTFGGRSTPAFADEVPDRSIVPAMENLALAASIGRLLLAASMAGVFTTALKLKYRRAALGSLAGIVVIFVLFLYVVEPLLPTTVTVETTLLLGAYGIFATSGLFFVAWAWADLQGVTAESSREALEEEESAWREARQTGDPPDEEASRRLSALKWLTLGCFFGFLLTAYVAQVPPLAGAILVVSAVALAATVAIVRLGKAAGLAQIALGGLAAGFLAFAVLSLETWWFAVVALIPAGSAIAGLLLVRESSRAFGVEGRPAVALGLVAIILVAGLVSGLIVPGLSDDVGDLTRGGAPDEVPEPVAYRLYPNFEDGTYWLDDSPQDAQLTGTPSDAYTATYMKSPELGDPLDLAPNESAVVRWHLNYTVQEGTEVTFSILDGNTSIGSESVSLPSSSQDDGPYLLNVSVPLDADRVEDNVGLRIEISGGARAGREQDLSQAWLELTVLRRRLRI